MDLLDEALETLEAAGDSRATQVLSGLRRAIHERMLGLIAFLAPLGIRALPEIILDPYPVGWDTMRYTFPTCWSGPQGKMGCAGILGTAPLLYTISVPVYLVTRVKPVGTFKTVGTAQYEASLDRL
jgi:hypothetical protein